MKYSGSCHCGAIQFEFNAEEITSGLRCNCSLCIRKGAIMSDFVLGPEQLTIKAEQGSLAAYEFGSDVAKHHFCNRCGIYPFHQTLRKPGHYRLNLGCIEGLDASGLPFDIFDGASL